MGGESYCASPLPETGRRTQGVDEVRALTSAEMGEDEGS